MDLEPARQDGIERAGCEPLLQAVDDFLGRQLAGFENFSRRAIVGLRRRFRDLGLPLRQGGGQLGRQIDPAALALGIRSAASPVSTLAVPSSRALRPPANPGEPHAVRSGAAERPPPPQNRLLAIHLVTTNSRGISLITAWLQACSVADLHARRGRHHDGRQIGHGGSAVISAAKSANPGRSRRLIRLPPRCRAARRSGSSSCVRFPRRIVGDGIALFHGALARGLAAREQHGFGEVVLPQPWVSQQDLRPTLVAPLNIGFLTTR